jgi:hypothetical protein
MSLSPRSDRSRSPRRTQTDEANIGRELIQAVREGDMRRVRTILLFREKQLRNDAWSWESSRWCDDVLPSAIFEAVVHRLCTVSLLILVDTLEVSLELAERRDPDRNKESLIIRRQHALTRALQEAVQRPETLETHLRPLLHTLAKDVQWNETTERGMFAESPERRAWGYFLARINELLWWMAESSYIENSETHSTTALELRNDRHRCEALDFILNFLQESGSVSEAVNQIDFQPVLTHAARLNSRTFFRRLLQKMKDRVERAPPSQRCQRARELEAQLTETLEEIPEADERYEEEINRTLNSLSKVYPCSSSSQV